MTALVILIAALFGGALIVVTLVQLLYLESLRLRPHVNDVIHDMGMDAPASELTILDPAPFVPAYSP